MADYYKFIIGLADSTSTPSTPVLDETDYHEYSINPDALDGSWQGGVMSTTISGNPRVSTTQVPKSSISLNWPKISANTKRAINDYYFLLNTKLILIDDQRYMYEVVVVPNSYKFSRRRSTKSEAESYSCQLQMMLLGAGTQISEAAREAL